MIQIPEIQLDYQDPFISDLSKKVLFLDIETSLIDARVFRTGNQFIGIDNLNTSTRILTVACGTLHDLEHKKQKAVTVYSNRKSKTFKRDPLDDREVLEKVWHRLDSAKVVVAHNASFDQGWLHGRFVELGWSLPSRYFLFCTYRNLQPFQFTSKKLDHLSKTLVGTEKLPTGWNLWNRCSNGDRSAFIEMEDYNRVDVYDTLFKVWKRTAYYNPIKAIDFTNPDSDIIQCKVDGGPLYEDGLYHNRTNGKVYNKYLNPRSNQAYQDRYNTDSKKAGLGLVKPLV